MRELRVHEDLPFLPARKSGEEWQPIAKRRQIPSWFTKAPPGRAGFFTPYSDWCPSHWLKADLAQPGPGTLSKNFVVYNNDKQFLINEIERIKSSYDPYEVLSTFKNIHPQLYRGEKWPRKFGQAVRWRICYR